MQITSMPTTSVGKSLDQRNVTSQLRSVHSVGVVCDVI